jgi:hypothetical protein
MITRKKLSVSTLYVIIIVLVNLSRVLFLAGFCIAVDRLHEYSTGKRRLG